MGWNERNTFSIAGRLKIRSRKRALDRGRNPQSPMHRRGSGSQEKGLLPYREFPPHGRECKFFGDPASAAWRPQRRLFEREKASFVWQRSEEVQGRKISGSRRDAILKTREILSFSSGWSGRTGGFKE